MSSIESDSKHSFSRSRCIGSEPGIHENLAELEMSTTRNELSARGKSRKAVGKTKQNEEKTVKVKKTSGPYVLIINFP